MVAPKTFKSISLSFISPKIRYYAFFAVAAFFRKLI